MQDPRLARLLRFARNRAGLHLCRVMVRPIGRARARAEAHEPIVYRPMAEDDLLPFCDDPVMELDPAQLHAAFERGDLCAGALDGSSLVGYVWFGFSTTPHTLGVWVEYPWDTRYSYKLFVRPEYRGRRIASRLYALGDAPRLACGRRYDLSFIDLDNSASIVSSIRGGGRAVGTAGFLRLPGGECWPFHSAGAAQWGFRFYVPGDGLDEDWSSTPVT